MNSTPKIDFLYYDIAAERPPVLLPVKGNTVGLMIEQEVCSRILQADFSDDIGILHTFLRIILRLSGPKCVILPIRIR